MREQNVTNRAQQQHEPHQKLGVISCAAPHVAPVVLPMLLQSRSIVLIR